MHSRTASYNQFDVHSTDGGFRRAIGLAFALILSVIGAEPMFAAEPEFIGDFMKREKEWNKLINVTVHLEGRYASISSNRISLQNCDLTFRSNKPLVKPTDSSTVEVIGHLTRDGGRFVFVVNRIADLPSELFRYERMVSKIDPQNPHDWHEVGLWIKRRGEFYDDDSLIQKSKTAFAKELDVELKAAEPDDLKGRLKLADKVTKLGLAATLREEIIHDAYVEQWRLISTDIQPKDGGTSVLVAQANKRLQILVEQIARDMPGSNEPVNPAQPELMKTYLAAPVKTYLEADEKQRRVLHRLLYAEALKSSILAEARLDRSQGYASAKKIEKQLPEFTPLAEQLRLDQLAWERSQISTYTRRQVLELAEKFKQRQQPEIAIETLTEWLDNRRDKLRADDAGEHVRLAEEYLNLVGGDEQAAKLLIAAYKLTPDVPEIAKRLTSLGLVLKNDEWLWTKDLSDPAQQSMERAIREGRVEVGMTRRQIRRSLGAPTSISRVRSLRSLDEVWMYRLGTTTLLAIQFGQNGRSDGPVANSINEVSNADFTIVPSPKPVENAEEADTGAKTDKAK